MTKGCVATVCLGSFLCRRLRRHVEKLRCQQCRCCQHGCRMAASLVGRSTQPNYSLPRFRSECGTGMVYLRASAGFPCKACQPQGVQPVGVPRLVDAHEWCWLSCSGYVASQLTERGEPADRAVLRPQQVHPAPPRQVAARRDVKAVEGGARRGAWSRRRQPEGSSPPVARGVVWCRVRALLWHVEAGVWRDCACPVCS